VAASGVLIVILPAYRLGWRVRLAVAAYGATIAAGVGFLFGPRAFGSRYFEGIAWPLNLVRVCAFLTIPTCLWLIMVAATRGSNAPATPASRFGILHLRLVCISAILMVVTLIAVDFISFKPIL
jgi:hypothetical protein